jgi:hypothetical protein
MLSHSSLLQVVAHEGAQSFCKMIELGRGHAGDSRLGRGRAEPSRAGRVGEGGRVRGAGSIGWVQVMDLWSITLGDGPIDSSAGPTNRPPTEPRAHMRERPIPALRDRFLRATARVSVGAPRIDPAPRGPSRTLIKLTRP